MKSVIFNPFTPIPKSDKSHVKGWSLLWSQRLNADIATKDIDLMDYNHIYIDHGVNFSGSLNLFGGFNEEVVSRFYNLFDALDNGAKLFSLDQNIHSCHYPDQIEKRIGAKTTSEMVDMNFVVRCAENFGLAKTTLMSDLNLTKAIIGDSHTAAFSTKDQAIYRFNGKTLYSTLRDGLYDFVKQNVKRKYEEITISLGSIDIRFHCLKHGRWTAKEFADKYAKQVLFCQDKLKTKFVVCAPVPIEFEGRKIPGTGQHKGNNFYGSRQQRLDYTLEVMDRLSDYFLDFDLISPPKEWYQMDGEKYAKEIMELASSVHIAPSHYRSTINW
jgi:hypothetical protein